MKKTAQTSKKSLFFWRQDKLWAFFLIFFLLRLPSLFEPFTYGDEGIYLTLGQALRKGFVFYRDIHDNKPPLLYLLAAWAGNFKTYRLIYFLWSLVGFLFFYTLAKIVFAKKEKPLITSNNGLPAWLRQILPSGNWLLSLHGWYNQKAVQVALFSFAILASIPLFEGQIGNAENFLIYTSIAAFLFLLLEKPLFFTSGFLFSLSTLFKVPAAFDFVAAIVVFFLLQNKKSKEILHSLFQKEFLLFVAGFLTPIFLSLIYYFTVGAGPTYLRAAFMQNIPYLSSWTQDKPQVGSFPLGLVLRSSTLILLIVILFLSRKKRGASKSFNLIITWFALAVFAALLSSRPYPHYLLQAVPALCLSLGFLFSQVNDLKLIPLFFGLILFYVFNRFDYYRYPVLAYYQNFYRFLGGNKSQGQYQAFWGNHVFWLYETAGYLKARTTPDEKIFIWGDQPSLYALAERLPVGRYTAAYHIKDFDPGYRETLTILSQEPPRFLVVLKSDEISLGPLLAFLEENYSPLKTIGKAKIYRHNQIKKR